MFSTKLSILVFIEIIGLEKNQSIVEIGSGYGNLTKYIIDKNPEKQNKFLSQSNIKIVNTKILKKIITLYIVNMVQW